jgi:hypothetical protein
MSPLPLSPAYVTQVPFKKESDPVGFSGSGLKRPHAQIDLTIFRNLGSYEARVVFRLDLEGEARGKLQSAWQAVGADFLEGSKLPGPHRANK